MRSVKIIGIIFILVLTGCTKITEIFHKESPHQKYRSMLEDSGLAESALGRLWIEKAEAVLEDSLIIDIPFREAGYFPASEVNAFAYRFMAKKGEQINIVVDTDTINKLNIFIDLFETLSKSKPAAFAEDNSLAFSVDKTGEYILRLQPELLKSGNFELSITRSPTLAFPVDGVDTKDILSFWGDPRDGGKRKHEGVDIFAERGTPVLAASDGLIIRTGTNRLGGNVVWLHTIDNHNLYYAHLDTQLVRGGQIVKTGDTLGLVGNTGNAITTPPHLHFGIYIPGEGAIDPFPFIDNIIRYPDEVNADKSLAGTWGKIMSRSAPLVINSEKIMLKQGTPLRINAASADFYRVSLPDGTSGFIESKYVHDIKSGSRSRITKEESFIYEHPDTVSAFIAVVEASTSLNVVGEYNDFLMVMIDEQFGWINKP